MRLKCALYVLVLIYETTLSGSHVFKVMEVHFINTVAITRRKMKRSSTIDTEYTCACTLYYSVGVTYNSWIVQYMKYTWKHAGMEYCSGKNYAVFGGESASKTRSAELLESLGAVKVVMQPLFIYCSVSVLQFSKAMECILTKLLCENSFHVEIDKQYLIWKLSKVQNMQTNYCTMERCRKKDKGKPLFVEYIIMQQNSLCL